MENDLAARRPTKLNAFRGWLMAFLIFHVPLALMYISNSLRTFAGFLQSGAAWYVAGLGMALWLLLAVSIMLLLSRKRIFRYFYAAYSVMMIVNFISSSGFTAFNVIFALAIQLPWAVYVFMSKRVEAVLNNETEPVPAAPTAYDPEIIGEEENEK